MDETKRFEKDKFTRRANAVSVILLFALLLTTGLIINKAFDVLSQVMQHDMEVMRIQKEAAAKIATLEGELNVLKVRIGAIESAPRKKHNHKEKHI